MRHQQEHEDEVLAAVREIAQSVNSENKAPTDMSSLMEATSCLSLSNLDYWERLIRLEVYSSNPLIWKLWAETKLFLPWVDLCSGNGYKREKTLRALSGAAPNSFFFALAVRRLNDWVPQVRDAAREKLPIIAKETDPEYVVDVLCATLPHWNSWGRLEDADKRILLEITALAEVAHSLRLRIISTATGPMATILVQAGRTDALDDSLIEIAKEAIQPSVRAKAYRSLLEGKIVCYEGRKWEWTEKQYCQGHFKPILSERVLSFKSPFLETLKLAAVDRSPVVRRVAGDMLIQQLTSIGNEALEIAMLLASDLYPSVAERGKFALKRLDA